jgi:hypothetical protein
MSLRSRSSCHDPLRFGGGWSFAAVGVATASAAATHIQLHIL